ncbi:MAG: T9SS type A sorting domain-containing protein [Bacteroidetes bacterium]|nr:T9SS type A sorting domain-containing protein [Bacteroidota bacterium]
MFKSLSKRTPLFVAQAIRFAMAFVLSITGIVAPSHANVFNGKSNGFIANVGQLIDERNHARNDVDFYLSNSSASVFIGSGQIQYVWKKPQPGIQGSERYKKIGDVEMFSMWVQLQGANVKAKPVTGDESDYYENYYLPHCNSKQAHSYSKIIYQDIYPNIDWVLYVDTSIPDGFKYDFVLHPGARVSDIKLLYKGAANLEKINGDVMITAAGGRITEHAPYTYEEKTGRKIISSFALNDNLLSFDVDGNDVVAVTTIIDPRISWVQRYKASPSIATCTASDTFAKPYLCGYTSASQFIVPLISPYQSHYGGGSSDCVISKYNPYGTSDIWTTYYGGEDADEIHAATCDFYDNLYITGLTASLTNISTYNSFQPTNGGATYSGGSHIDAFIAKFDGYGSLTWATYFGGVKVEIANAIAFDNFNSIYIGGVTTGTDSIATPGCFQSTPDIGFLARFNAANGYRSWGTYYNGVINTINVSNRNKIFIGGSTFALTGIATSGAFQTSFSGAAYDGFVAMFEPDGTRRWGTYYGGGGVDEVFGLTNDSLGNVFVGGATESTGSGLSTTGALYTSGFGTRGGMIGKLDSVGHLRWGSYYPGKVTSLALGPDNRVYFGGVTDYTTGIATANAYQSQYTYPLYATNLIAYDGFIGELDLDGKRLYGTYFGDGSIESSTFVNYNYGQWLVSYTIDSPGITLGYLMEFEGDTSVFIKYPYVDSILCAGGSLDVNYKVTKPFAAGNIFKVQLSDISGSFNSAVDIGTVTSSVAGIINCTIPAGITEGMGYKLRIVASAPADTFYNYNVPIRISHYHRPVAEAQLPICANLNLTLMDSNAAAAPADLIYEWINPNPLRSHGAFAHYIVNDIKLVDSGDYILVANNHGCISRDTVHVHITVAPPEPLVTGDTLLCTGDTLILTAHSAVDNVTFGWFKPDNSFINYDSVIIVPGISMHDSGLYRVAAIFDGCQSDPNYGQLVIVHPRPMPAAGSNSPICTGDTLKLRATDILAGLNYNWSGPGFGSQHKDTIIANTTITASGNYIITTTTKYGCSNSDTIAVLIKPLPANIDATSNSPLCSGKELQFAISKPTPGTIYNWTGPLNYSSADPSPVINNAATNQSGMYYVAANLDGCIKTDSVVVTIIKTPDTPAAGSNSPLTTGGVLKLFVKNVEQGVSYNWSGPNSFNSNSAAVTINSAIPAMSGTYTVLAINQGCSSWDTVNITVSDPIESKDIPFVMFPNPNNGSFRIVGSSLTNDKIQLAVFATDGRVIYRSEIQPISNKVDEQVTITGLAAGVYRLKIRADGKPSVISFTVGGR